MNDSQEIKLSIGDFVVSAYYGDSQLYVGIIVRFTKLKVVVQEINGSSIKSPEALIKINDPIQRKAVLTKIYHELTDRYDNNKLYGNKEYMAYDEIVNQFNKL